MPNHNTPFSGEFPDDLDPVTSPVFDAEIDPTSIPGNPDYADPETFASQLDAHPEDPPGIMGEAIVQSELNAAAWRMRAVEVQTMAVNGAIGGCALLMAKYIHDGIKHLSPNVANPVALALFHNAASIGVILCGATMAGTSAIAAYCRSRAWKIEQEIEDVARRSEDES